MGLLWFSAFGRSSPCPLLKEGVGRGRGFPASCRAPLSFGHFPRERGKPWRTGFRGIAAALGPQFDNFLFLHKARALPKSPDRRPGARVLSASRTPSLGSLPRVRALAVPHDEAGPTCSG